MAGSHAYSLQSLLDMQQSSPQGQHVSHAEAYVSLPGVYA